MTKIAAVPILDHNIQIASFLSKAYSMIWKLGLDHREFKVYTVYKMSLVVRKPVFGISDQVRHKSDCTASEDGYRLENWDIGSRGIVLCSENKNADQLRSDSAADLRLCFAYEKAGFLTTRLKS